MKKIFILLFFCGLFIINPAFAENFVIKNYDVKINVQNNNVLHIEEVIVADFHNRSHGIFRTIPIINNVVRADGSRETKKAKISNMEINNSFSTSYKNGKMKYKIGNAHRYILGEETYILKYDYSLPNDKLKNIDEFYFNIIGTEWPVEIQNVTFTITMPKEFDAQKAGFSVGSYGHAGHTERIFHSIENNLIKGHTLNKLSPYEGITIRIELPNGYFDKHYIDWQTFLISLFCVFITAVTYFMWNKLGKDKKIIPVVTFHPPANLNSAEAGVLYDLAADNKDIVSLVVYLAHKGYIGINMINSCDFELTKLKEYQRDKGNEIEKLFMEALFRNGNKITDGELQISETFYKDILDLKHKLNEYKHKNFTKSSISFSTLWFPVVSTFSLFVIMILSLFGLAQVEQIFVNPANIFNLILTTIFAVVFLSVLGAIIKGLFGDKISYILFAIGIIIIPHIFIQNTGTVDFLIYYITVVCFLISLICTYNMPKRNIESAVIVGQLMGLKKYIEVAEKQEIQSLVEKNPNAFFNILPFAYVLDVEDKWINKFEGMLPENPQWCTGDINDFSSFLYSLDKYSEPSYANGGISKSSSSSGTSSSGGGGFSGGGCGGGGGGSW